MAQQIKKKFIGDNQVDGTKLRLLSDQTLRKDDGSGGEIDVIAVLETADATLQSNIDAEASARAGADSSLQTAIDAEKTRVDAILSASQADKDSFAEIVTLINSVDTENDTAFAGYVLSNDAALAQEISDRQAGDSALDTRVTALENDEEVLVYNSLAAFPASGEASKIYVAKDTNKIYHWVETSGGGESFDHTVGASGDFADLATALADASVQNGDKIKILNGTYNLSAQLVIDKEVQIFGESKAGVILQSSADGSAPVGLISVTANNAALINMTIKHRKTTLTSLENSLTVTSDSFIMSAVQMEYVEFAVVFNAADAWMVKDCSFVYAGPAGNDNRPVAVYGMTGNCFVDGCTFDDGGIAANVKPIFMASEPTSGKLVIDGNSSVNVVHQFLVVEELQGTADSFDLLVKDNTTSETSAYVLIAGDSNDVINSITVSGNSLSHSHTSGGGGKGIVTFYGSGDWGAIDLHVDNNTLQDEFFRSGYQLFSQLKDSSGNAISSGFAAGSSTSFEPTIDVTLDAVIPASPSQSAVPSLSGGSTTEYKELSEKADLSALQAADATLQSNIDAEETARLAGDSALQSAIDTEKDRIDAILLASEADKDSFAEIVTLINSVDTENDTAFAGYVLSNDAALAQEVSDRQAGDSALSDRLDVLEAQESEEVVFADSFGDFPATGEDSKLYVDKSLDRVYRWDSVDSEYKALDVRYGYKKFGVGVNPTLHAQGYVEVFSPQGYMPNSVNVHVGRLAAYETQDFLVSQEGSYVRITWRNSLASGGNEEVVPGDLVQISFPFAY